MMTFNESDYDFIRQAIRYRAELMINQICAPIDMFAEIKDEDIPVKKLDLSTLTLKEEAKPVVDPNAPWGYKKDGTPRARPGRPTKRRIAKRK